MDLFYAALLTVFAGLATGIGGASAFFIKKRDEKILPISLGFAAGVMVYLSLTEIFIEAKELLIEETGAFSGSVLAAACFFAGIAVISLIDVLIPHGNDLPDITDDNETMTHHDTDASMPSGARRNLMRTGIFTAAAVSAHNIPEGIALFFSALRQPSIALPLAAAVIIHNIPVGIAVSIPIYYATGNKLKAFMYALATGLTQPAAALVGCLLLTPVLNGAVFGALYAAVAGFMVFIALDDLLPSAFKHGKHHYTTYGLIAGMAVMAISILLFE